MILPRRKDPSERTVLGRLQRPIMGTLCLVLLAGLTGCGTLGNSKLVKQLQIENERLLSEYRVQRDELARTSQQLASTRQKLAESEKMLARQYPLNGNIQSRISRNDYGGTSNGANGNAGSIQASRQPPNGSAASASGGQLAPDTSSRTGTTANSDLQWRPLKKYAR